MHPQRHLIKTAKNVVINEVAIPMMVQTAKTIMNTSLSQAGNATNFSDFFRILANSPIGTVLGTSSNVPQRVRDRYDSPEDREAREQNSIAAQQETKRLEQEGRQKRRQFAVDSAKDFNRREQEWENSVIDQYGSELFDRVKAEIEGETGVPAVGEYGQGLLDRFARGESLPSVIVDGGRGIEGDNTIAQNKIKILDRMNAIRQQERDDAKSKRDAESAALKNETNKKAADNARARLELGDDYYNSPMNTPTGKKNREEDERTVAAYDQSTQNVQNITNEVKKGNVGALSFGNMLKMLGTGARALDNTTS